MAQVLGALEEARAAAESHAWRTAYDAYSRADARELTPDDLEKIADAAYWTGNIDEAIAFRERAYAGFASAGEPTRAARLALTLSWNHMGRAAYAIANGWFAKAERLLEDVPESVEHGHLLIARGSVKLYVEGDLRGALDDFERAYEIGRRFGNAEVQTMALTFKGKVLLIRGEADAAFALFDEATAAAVSGELPPFSTGIVYCCTISSCEDVGDYRRSAEWSEAAKRWCERLDINGFPGACRVHHAKAVRVRGDWAEAEQHALAACDELQAFDRSITAFGLYEVAEIRRRRGEFAAAEEAYRESNALGREPQPGLALLRLAEGKVDAAAAAIKRALEDVADPLRRIAHLPAQVEIAVAARDLKTARAAADELEQLVDMYKLGGRRTPAFDGTVHFARGQISLSDGDTASAARCLRRARDEWQQVGAPYETAQARLLLGLAYRREGDEDGAMSELEAAQVTFERLGAKLDEERAKELLGKLETRRTFLFTDIVDSTKLLETLGDAKWKKLLARHDELLRERIGGSGGDVIKQTGDGFFAAFDNPKGAIEAAVAIQRALADEIVAPDVRIGLHTGGAFHTDDNFSDYGGQGVHTAARIGAVAEPGEIVVSRETIEGLAGAFRLSEPRSQTLKGFDRPVEVVSVDWR